MSPPKDVLHQTVLAPIYFGTKTSWPLAFSESLGRAGKTVGDGRVGYVRGGDKGRWKKRGHGWRGSERGGYSRIGY